MDSKLVVDKIDMLVSDINPLFITVLIILLLYGHVLVEQYLTKGDVQMSQKYTKEFKETIVHLQVIYVSSFQTNVVFI